MGLLIENALRQRPDRIIVGEIRSAEAAAAFIDAVNTGHAGTMSTIHANGATDALAGSTCSMPARPAISAVMAEGALPT